MLTDLSHARSQGLANGVEAAEPAYLDPLEQCQKQFAIGTPHVIGPSFSPRGISCQ